MGPTAIPRVRRRWWRSLVVNSLRVLKGDTRRTKVVAKGVREGVLRFSKDGRSSDVGQPRGLAVELDGIASL